MATYDRVKQDIAIEFLGKNDDEKLSAYNGALELKDFGRALLIANIFLDGEKLVSESSHHSVGGVTRIEDYGSEKIRVWKTRIQFCESEIEKAEKITQEQVKVGESVSNVIDLSSRRKFK